MKKTLLLLTSLAAFGGFARATVTYQTSGIFNCSGITGCGTNVLDFGTSPLNSGVPDVILTFLGEPSNTVTPVTGGSFGDLIVSCGDGNADCGTEAIPSGITLTITIDQTSPAFAPSTLSLDATLTAGNLAENSSGTVAVGWASQSSTSFPDGTAYAIGPLNQPLVPPSSNGGDLTLQGTITTATNLTPEPATFGLLGAALLGLSAIARKRKA